MEIKLQRIRDDGEATLGALHVGNLVVFTLEDQHQDTKVAGETRIPSGRYYLKKRRYGRFYDAYNARWGHDYVLVLVDVPGFTDILIHTGNKDEHTDGCILVGFGANIFAEAEVSQSRPAYLAVWSMIDDAFGRGEKVRINIIDEENSNV